MESNKTSVDDDEFSLSPETIAALKQIAANLTLRARERQRAGQWFLIACISLVVVCLVIFSYANLLTNQQDVRTPLSLLKFGVERSLTKIDSIENSSDRIIRNLKFRDSIISEIQIQLHQRKLVSAKFDAFLDSLQIVHGEIARQNMRQLSNIKTTQLKLYDELEPMAFIADSLDANLSTYEFFTTLSTRIGIIVIVLFIVQMLLRIYRYNVRLGNYYKARADAIEIYLEDESLELDRLIEVLSPDSLDIGTVKAPLEQVVEIFKHARSQNIKAGEG